MAVRMAALSYLTVVLIIPLVVILEDGLQDGLSGLWNAISRPVAWNALLLSLWTAGVMALINAVTCRSPSQRS
jgi:sulfate transport system permease protein